jgi:hypothetical protein
MQRSVRDFWGFEGYGGLPRLEPAFPVIDIHEDNVVHALSLNERLAWNSIALVKYVGRELQSITHYVHGLDVRNNKVLSSSKCPPGTRPLQRLFASEFSSYMNKVIAHFTFSTLH